MRTMVLHDVEAPGISRHLRCTFELEEPDAGCGQVGGWFLTEAVLPGHAIMDRREFEVAFGRDALAAVEDDAERYAREEAEPERHEHRAGGAR